MTNQVTQDAEESSTIEKTASEQTDNTTQSTDTPATEGAAVAAPENATEVPIADSTAQAGGVSGGSSEPMQAAAQTAAPAQSPAPAETPDEGQAAGDIDFGAILEQFEQEQTVYHSGEMVNGTVVGVTDRGVLVDFGYKSEGYVPLEEFTGPDGQVTATVGESVEVIIRSMHSGEGAPLLSRQDALGRKVWDEIEAAFQAETPITGRVVDKTKGGLRVDINGIEAFLPGSQIDSRPIRGLDTYIGTEIEAKIIKFSRRRNNIVLSRKVLTDEVVNVQKAETLGKIDVGYIVDGTVKNLTEYGAFVDIGGIDGLLHVTDMSWGRIHHPGDLFKVGDHVQVKVLKLDREKEKVSLGFKQLQPDPWSTVVEVYPVNTKLTGKVSSVTDYGVFVELEPGVEGLVHVSEISWARRSQSPKRMFQKGQEVEVQVLGVDTVEKRISLGMKQFQENPWDTVDIRYPVGARVQGRVRNLTDFGAFVELEEGIDGLVHVSDISWAKKIKHPKDVLKKDQEVEAIVTSIDKRGQRLSLSMKDLTPSAWEGFVATHRPGDVVKGKVSRFTNFGVFVELGEGLEGLCHISELSDDRVERAEDVAQLGQEMDFKILRIEPADQKIGLSHRAVGKESESGGGGGVDSRMYSTEAKSGMASLGELAKLRGGAAETETPEDPEERKRAKQAAKKARAEEFAAREAEAAANPQPEPTGDEEAGEGAESNESTETGEMAESGQSADGESAADENSSAVETQPEAEPVAVDATENAAAPLEDTGTEDSIGGGDLTDPPATEETALDTGSAEAGQSEDVEGSAGSETAGSEVENQSASEAGSENSGGGEVASAEGSSESMTSEEATSSDQADGSASSGDVQSDIDDAESKAV